MCRPGGRRCPGQNSPEHRAVINARRRARYAARVKESGKRYSPHQSTVVAEGGTAGSAESKQQIARQLISKGQHLISKKTASGVSVDVPAEDLSVSVDKKKINENEVKDDQKFKEVITGQVMTTLMIQNANVKSELGAAQDPVMQFMYNGTVRKAKLVGYDVDSDNISAVVLTEDGKPVNTFKKFSASKVNKEHPATFQNGENSTYFDDKAKAAAQAVQKLEAIEEESKKLADDYAKELKGKEEAPNNSHLFKEVHQLMSEDKSVLVFSGVGEGWEDESFAVSFKYNQKSRVIVPTGVDDKGNIGGIVISENGEPLDKPVYKKFSAEKMDAVIMDRKDHSKPLPAPKKAKEEIKAMATPKPTVKKKKGQSGKVENTFSPSDWSIDDITGDKLFKPAKRAGKIHKELNVKQYTNSGYLAKEGYFAQKSFKGKIDPYAIEENTASEVFGFNKVEEESEYRPKRKLRRDVFIDASEESTKEIDEETESLIREYTGIGYQTINRNLYNPNNSKESSNKSDQISIDNDGLGKYVGNLLPHKTSPVGMKHITEKMDASFKEYGSTEQQHLVRYQRPDSRAVLDAGGPKEFIKQFKAGNTVQFDNYQSTTPVEGSANNFLDDNGIRVEMLTPGGINVRRISSHSSENEVMLPRGMKFMSLGMQENVVVNGVHSTVVQLVAVNDKGEIWDGSNWDGPTPIDESEKWAHKF